MMRRVLLIAARFPPTANVAAHRPGKYARYLPKFGWQPVVLTHENPAYGRDPSILEGIGPDVVVRRLPSGDSRYASALLRRLGLTRWVSLPDDQYGWAAAVATEGASLLREFRPEAIVCSCVPLAGAVGAVLLRRSVDVPLVLDFHNEWTRNMYFDPPTPVHARLQARLEEWVVRRADAVVTLNPLHTQDYTDRFPGIRVETIQNGFDPEDFRALRPPEPARSRPVVFTYAGAVYGHQSPAPVVEVLDRLVREGRLRPEEVEIRILGDPFRNFVETPRSVRVVVKRDLRHAGLVEEFSATDYFFLCLEPPAARQLPAKLYEYLAARRPTLVVAPADGAAARLIAETGGGRVASEGLDGIVLEWVRAARSGAPVCTFRDEVIRSFERERLVGDLARLLDRLAR